LSSRRSTAAFFSTRSVLRKGRMTSRVSSSEAARIACFTCSWIGASLVAMNRVPMFMPSAPSDRAADQRAAVGHAARGDERDLELLGRARQQDEVGHVVLAGMAAAFEAVDADGVAADRFGLQRMAHRGAFVDHLDARLALSAGSHFCGLLPAVSTIFTPPSMMARM
jgi:hypothetical protein